MSTVPPRSPIHRRVDELAQPPRRELHFDPLLAVAAIGLITCSLVVLGVATRDDVLGQPHYFLYRQAAYAVVGVILMIAVARIDYSRLRELKYGLYTSMIALILLVVAVGTTTRGSRRSFSLPFFSLQPSELGKLFLVLALSAFVVDRTRRIGDRDTTARVMLAALVPAALVMLQPDLGTGLVYAVIGVAVLFVAGTAWRHFAALGALAAAAIALSVVVAPAVGMPVLKGYQVDRLTAFLNPSENPRDQGYQQNQSRIAIGSGEKTGRGPEKATQTRLNFLPEHHTDFVFAVVGEAFGFLGAAVVLSLYALLIWRSLRIVPMAKNLYGALIAGGISAMLMFQVFVNVGMTVGIMPITGIPLPLLSYGGSSVIVTFLAIGLLQSIHVQGRLASGPKVQGLL
ncbi:MAG TPA: rod shape-determining protein RodA [Solirubrobacteraceae bacterium]|jgi:rod shape determining protein RodA|nr:rod shape-determining protein RodA [Solirubrobacteraceae bacterium]